jgi:hypothetical protein
MKRKTTGFYEVLTFGKYKGKKVVWVYNNDAQYLVWAVNNLWWFNLSNLVLNKINKKLMDV